MSKITILSSTLKKVSLKFLFNFKHNWIGWIDSDDAMFETSDGKILEVKNDS